jgi:hypothetical protein
MIMLDGNKGGDMPAAPSYNDGVGAVKKSSPKKEEEISIEDIPF